MAWSSPSSNRLPTRQWRRLRAAILALEPFCRSCAAKGIVTIDSLATEVDHIVSLADGGSTDPGNLQPICSGCHALKTAQESARARGVSVPMSVKVKPVFGADGWPSK